VKKTAVPQSPSTNDIVAQNKDSSVDFVCKKYIKDKKYIVPFPINKHIKDSSLIFPPVKIQSPSQVKRKG
jgi:hypothetical protein